MKVTQHHADPHELTVERVARACHDVNTSLSTVVLCIEFLAERFDIVGDGAVQDARAAVRRISTVMATLRDISEPDAPAPAPSAVFRKTDPARTDRPKFEAKRSSEPSPHS
jgi:hypothetical protein